MEPDHKPKATGKQRAPATTLFATLGTSKKFYDRVDQFNRDPREIKIDLLAGVIRDQLGLLHTLPVAVETAGLLAAKHQPAGYPSPLGHPLFRFQVEQLLLGQGLSQLNSRVATIQTVGATHGLHLVAKLAADQKLFSQVLISNESWGEHPRIFEAAGCKVGRYPYLAKDGRGIGLDGMLSTLRVASPMSAVVLQLASHNPTGYDLSSGEWEKVFKVCQERKIFPIFDGAGIGYGKGLDQDLAPFRTAINIGLEGALVTSWCKLLSMPSLRLGSLTLVGSRDGDRDQIEPALKVVVRNDIGAPPYLPGEIVSTILGDNHLRKRFVDDLEKLRIMIGLRRGTLVQALETRDAPRALLEIRSQQGIYSWSGLTRDQCQRLRHEFAIYLPSNGRLCISALVEEDISRVADALVGVISPPGTKAQSEMVEGLFNDLVHQLAPSPASWGSATELRSYAVRQATSCLYLDKLLPNIVDAAPDLAQPRLKELVHQLRRCHSRQFGDLKAIVPVEWDPSQERRSYYFDELYKMCRIPVISKDVRLTDNQLLNLLCVHATSYLRGRERYAILGALDTPKTT